MSTKDERKQEISNNAPAQTPENSPKSSGRVSAKLFLWMLLTHQSGLDVDYDEVLVAGVNSVGHTRFHLKKGGKIVKSTKPSRIEGAEDVSTRSMKGEGVRHYFYQLMRNKRTEVYQLDYDSFLISNLSGKSDYEVTVLRHDKEVKKLSVPKDLGEDEGRSVNYRTKPDYSQDPWE